MPIDLTKYGSRELPEGGHTCRIMRVVQPTMADASKARYVELHLKTRNQETREIEEYTHRLYVPEHTDYEYAQVLRLATACKIPASDMKNFGERYYERWELFEGKDVVIVLKEEQAKNGKTYKNAYFSPLMHQAPPVREPVPARKETFKEHNAPAPVHTDPENDMPYGNDSLNDDLPF